jgi:hypothetical protein
VADGAVARPGTVLVDRWGHDALATEGEDGRYLLCRLPRVAGKGYSRLEAWAARRPLL